MSEPGNEELMGFVEIGDLKSELKKNKNIKIEKTQEDTLQQDQLQQTSYLSKFAGQTVGVKDSRSLFALSEDVHRDKVSLGKKTWKPNKTELLRNREIDRAKALTKDATADTMSIYTTLQKMHEDEHYDLAKASTDVRYNAVLFNKFQNVKFTPKMITSSYLRKNFKSMYELVYSYTVLKTRTERLSPEERERLNALAPKMEILSRRLHYFAEVNHVSLMGKEAVKGKDSFKDTHIISDKEMEGHDYAKFSEEDKRQWFSVTSSEKEERKRERRREALTPVNLSAEELNEAMTKSVTEDEMFVGGREALLNMSKEERIRSLPAISKRLEFVQKKITENKPEDAEHQLEYRRELAELQTVINLAVQQATLTKLTREANGGIDLTNQVFEASEEVRALKKRQQKEGDVQPEVTQPAGVIALTREEALSTDSDKESFAAKTKLYDSAMKITVPDDGPLSLYSVGIKAVKDAAARYYDTSHYSQGYKAEVSAMKDLQKALSKLPKEAFDQIPALSEFKTLLSSQTDGGLVIDPDFHDPEFMDMSDRRPVDEAPEGSEQFKTSVDIRDGLMNNPIMRSWDDKSDDPLFAHEPTVNDLRQGKVSNCWMVAATTAAINYDPSIIKNCMKDNGNGTVTVRLYRMTGVQDKNGYYQPCAKPVYITVKKEVPRLVVGGAIQTSGALWMQMLEKAAAFLGREDGRKGYKSLWYGNGKEWLFALTGHTGSGIAGEKVAYRNNELGIKTIRETDDKDRLFEDIMNAKKNGYVYHYGSLGSTSAGMNSGHAYAVLGGKVINGEKFVLLRNPYANMTLKYGEDGKESMSGSFISSEINETCGQFLIKLDDFIANMKDLSRTNLKSDIRYDDDARARFEQIKADREAERKAKESQPRDEAEIEAEKKAIQKELEGFEVL